MTTLTDSDLREMSDEGFRELYGRMTREFGRRQRSAMDGVVPGTRVLVRITRPRTEIKGTVVKTAPYGFVMEDDAGILLSVSSSCRVERVRPALKTIVLKQGRHP